MTTEPSTLADSLLIEQQRARELLEQYTMIGSAGAFGVIVIRDVLSRTERAVMEGDIVEMVRCHEELKGLK